jgi:hypothetical protein
VPVSRYRGDVQRTSTRAASSTLATLILAAAVSTGCSASDDLLSSVALPADDTTTLVSGIQDPGAAGSVPPAGGGSGSQTVNKLTVTGQQRSYLDALAAGGVHPSSELLALSIGSYVCQARAAGQTPQAVWDFVHPLVSTDVHDAHMSSMPPTPADVDTATESYIRIATERLC